MQKYKIKFINNDVCFSYVNKQTADHIVVSVDSADKPWYDPMNAGPALQ